MSTAQLTLTLSLYILSIALALILSIIRFKKSIVSWKLIFIIHVLLFIVFLLLHYLFQAAVSSRYFFLFFFCTGIISGGYLLRSDAPLLLRIYFSIYIGSIIVFISSPSYLVRAISLSNEKPNEIQVYRLTGNYFLEEEQMMKNIPDSAVTYKITQHFGVFHKTLSTNLRFGSRLDSIAIVSFDKLKGTRIVGFHSIKTPNFTRQDSLELFAVFHLQSKERIQKRNTN